MSQILPPFLMLAGLAGIIILIARKLPNLSEFQAAERERHRPSRLLLLIRRFGQKFQNEHSSRFLAGALRVIERILLRLRVGFLRIENYLNTLVLKVRMTAHRFHFRSKYWKRLSRMREEMERAEREIQPPDAKHQTTTDQQKAVPSTQPMKWIEWKRIEQQYVEIIVRNPRDITAYKRLAEIYLGQENFQDARASLEEVLRLNPMDEEARTMLRQLNSRAVRIKTRGRTGKMEGLKRKESPPLQ